MFKKIRERSLHFMIFAFLTGLFLGVNLSFKAEALEPAHGYLDYFHQSTRSFARNMSTPSDEDLFYGAIRGISSAQRSVHALSQREDSPS